MSSTATGCNCYTIQPLMMGQSWHWHTFKDDCWWELGRCCNCMKWASASYCENVNFEDWWPLSRCCRWLGIGMWLLIIKLFGKELLIF
jgi:hypothetical protein